MKRAKKTLKYISLCLGLGIILLIGCLQVSITYTQPLTREELFHLLKDPRVQAFLDTIAYSEGTFNSNGYRTQYTYRLFMSFLDHPREVICAKYKGVDLCSTAAGRYQFLKRTWDEIATQIGAKDFGPINQDLGALLLIVQKEALELVLKIKTKKDFTDAIYKVNKTWASLPGAPYGQPVRPMDKLAKVFKKQLQHHKKHRADLYKKYSDNNMLATPTINEEDED